MLVGSDGKPSRAAYEVANDGSKERVDRKTGAPLPKPKK